MVISSDASMHYLKDFNNDIRECVLIEMVLVRLSGKVATILYKKAQNDSECEIISGEIEREVGFKTHGFIFSTAGKLLKPEFILYIEHEHMPCFLCTPLIRFAIDNLEQTE